MPLQCSRRQLLLAASALTLGARPAGAAGARRVLPREVTRILARERIPVTALSAVVQEVNSPRPQLEVNPRAPVNPASLAKLLTTYAALDLLGPAWTWSTPVWLQGTVREPGANGVLEGSLVIKGSGDPKLTVERVRALLARVRTLGVREIRGDIVLDQSAFEPPLSAPGDFDNEPLRPYNVGAQALLLAQKSLLYTFIPDAGRGLAVVGVDPPLHGLRVDASVPLGDGPCEDWRKQLGATLADPQQVRFAGSYPAACGERVWPVAYADPQAYHARLLRSLWLELGGSLAGSVREGAAPAGAAPTFELQSPPLAEIVRDINKYSNNVMAQQLFLTLGLQRMGQGTSVAAKETLRLWVADRLGSVPPELVIDNGSGLSRDVRMSAGFLAQLLLHAWRSPVMAELVSSLPITGLDGTLRRSRATSGRAHLKTGSLRDVAGVAGYVLADDGRRHVLAAVLQHPNANAGREALDALVQWTMTS